MSPRTAFVLPDRDTVLEKKQHHFHESSTHTLAHNAQERNEWRPGNVDLKHACKAVPSSISCNDPISPFGFYYPAISQLPHIAPPVVTRNSEMMR